MTHLVIIDYGDDAERKRVDYVIEKWKDRGFEKAKGIVVKADEDDIRGFIDELYSKISAGEIEVYRSEKEEVSPEKMIEMLKISFDEDIKSVERFFSFIFSKKNAVLKSQRSLNTNFSEMEYGVYTRKGGVDVRIALKKNKKTAADIRIEGIENAPESMKEELMEDLSYFNITLEEE
jgi:hypothetical protein